MENEQISHKRTIKNAPTSFITNQNVRQDLIKRLVENIKNKIEKDKSIVTLVVDRIEGMFAVCENRLTQEMSNVKLEDLPNDVKEGDILKFENNEFQVDEQTKKEIEERINNKIKNLFE